MAERTGIEWCDGTWSPWEGCQKAGPGCDNCYAEAMNKWLRKGENWGPGAPRREFSDEHWKKPHQWNAKAAAAGKRMSVFPSVCDPFDNAVSNTRRARFISLMWDTPCIDWLLLTKRIGNVPALLQECTEPGKDWRKKLPPNVRVGATMVNQSEWDRDVLKLLALPFRNFVSLEPLLGSIYILGLQGNGHTALSGIDWVIAGGESGRNARPMHPEWIRLLQQQCAAAGVPFLLKQHGEFASVSVIEGPGSHHTFADGATVRRVGKKAAGRLLDGVEHNGFPGART